jgi:DNA-binding NarL/FixJ family response regulator
MISPFPSSKTTTNCAPRLARLLNRAEGFRCVSHYADAESALAGLPAERPEVVLVDINLPGMNGVEFVRRLKQAAPEILSRHAHRLRGHREHLQRAGRGRGGLSPQARPARELLDAIREVRRGGSPMTTHIARKVVQSFQKAGSRRRTPAAAAPTPFPRASRKCLDLSEPGLSLQGNRGQTGHQLRDRPHLHPPHLREASSPHPHRSRRQIPPPLTRPAAAIYDRRKSKPVITGGRRPPLQSQNEDETPLDEV